VSVAVAVNDNDNDNDNVKVHDDLCPSRAKRRRCSVEN